MKFVLEIELGNDAMRKYTDIGRELKKLNGQWHERTQKPDKNDYATIRDINGNKVGYWEITE